MATENCTHRTESLSAESAPSCLGLRLPGPIFAVASPANGSGKTSLAAALVAAMPGSTAVKFTTVRMDGTRCPRNAGSCACHSLQGEYTLIEDPDVLLQPGTDTWRLATAGARRVLWCLAWPGTYGPLLGALASRLDRGPLVTEGNSVLGHLPEARVVFVLKPDQPAHRFKKSTFDLLRRAALVVVNAPPGAALQFPWEDRAPEAAAQLRAELERRPVVQTDLREPLPRRILDLLQLAG